MVGYTGLNKSSTKIMERDEALIILCRTCLFFCFLITKKNISFKFLFTFKPWLLNSFDLPSYGSELRKRYTLRLYVMCLEERNFGSCSACGNRGQMTHVGERCAWGGLEVGGNLQIDYKMSFIKGNFWRVRRHFMCTFHWLFLGHYILNRNTKNAYIWICLQKCPKELAINTGKPLKNIAASNISKNYVLIFLP